MSSRTGVRGGPKGLLAQATAFVLLAVGSIAVFLPGSIHDPVERVAGAFLVAGTVVWARALRTTARAQRDLRAQLRAHEELEETLAASRQRLALAHGVARIGTWDMDDLETMQSTWSGGLRSLYGISDDAPTGYQAFLALVHPEDRERVERTIEPAIEAGGEFELEYRVCRPDGEVRWLLSRGQVLVDPEGRATRVIGAAVDVHDRRTAEAEREQLEAQLRQAQKLEAVGRLAGGVAHDFNNLLLAIRGHGELALGSLGRGEDAREAVADILAAADRASALTRQLLAFSRRQVLRPEVLDLNEVVGELGSLLGRLIGEDVELSVSLGEDAVHVEVDRSQLEQVIVNLAVNARDAMPDGGGLTIDVRRAEPAGEPGLELPPGRVAVLTVVDTGGGMDAATAAQAVEPFFTTKEGGTGLGLATVHGVVMQSGGALRIDSEPGRGTTVGVSLPLAECEARVPETQPRTAVPSGCGESVLLVEDDPHVRRIVALMLETNGYRVEQAGSDEEALRLADPALGALDLLLTDLVMPGLGGRVLALRVGELQPSARVLYMSGYTDDVVVRRGIVDRSAALLQKPFGSDELARRVREALDGRPARRTPSARSGCGQVRTPLGGRAA